MKIGVFVSVIGGQKGFESNVSGHIQVPLRSISELLNSGHDVHLITNSFSEERSVPFCLPDNITIHYVTDARLRGGVLERTSKPKSGVNFLKLFKQVLTIKKICKREKFDVLHLFGYNRTAYLAGGLKLFGLKTPVVVTMFAALFPEKFKFFKKPLWNLISELITATSFVKERLDLNGHPTTQVRHGVIREILKEHDGSSVGPKKRVLFWRDLTVHNGADIALESFLALAPKYPDIQFTFAVRPHWDEIEGISDQVDNVPNISIYRFPYDAGINLPKLIMESLCVMMPIRDISIDPQLVIVESLAAGVPVIATDQRSNPEFVVEGKTGFLIPLGSGKAATNILDRMLSNQEETLTMGQNASSFIETNWNWNNYVLEIEEVYNRAMKSNRG